MISGETTYLLNLPWVKIKVKMDHSWFLGKLLTYPSSVKIRINADHSQFWENYSPIPRKVDHSLFLRKLLNYPFLGLELESRRIIPGSEETNYQPLSLEDHSDWFLRYLLNHPSLRLRLESIRIILVSKQTTHLHFPWVSIRLQEDHSWFWENYSAAPFKKDHSWFLRNLLNHIFLRIILDS